MNKPSILIDDIIAAKRAILGTEQAFYASFYGMKIFVDETIPPDEIRIVAGPKAWCKIKIECDKLREKTGCPM